MEAVELVEKFIELRLDTLDCVLTEQLEQLVVRDEVKAREFSALFIKVLFDFLLNFFHLTVVREELIQALLGAVSLDQLLGIYLFHSPCPGFVDCIELSVFFVAPIFDFFGRGKDVLEIQPVTLAELPLLNRVSDKYQHVLLLLDFLRQALDIARPLDITDAGERVIQNRDNAVPVFQFVNIQLLFVLDDSKFSVVPCLDNLVELSPQVKLLRCSR